GMRVAGLAVFGAASLAGSFATSAGQLIAARAVMGLGAAMMFPSTLSLLTNVFTERRQRALAIGVWGARAGVGIALGPIAGGWLLYEFWWGSIFLFLVPIAGGVGRLGAWRGAPPRRPRAPRGPAHAAGRLARLCPVHGRDEPDRVRHHPGARVGLGLGRDHRRARRGRRGLWPAGGGRAASRQPDDRREPVPQPALHRRGRLGGHLLLRAAGVHLPGDAVLPGGAGVQPAGHRGTAAAGRGV